MSWVKGTLLCPAALAAALALSGCMGGGDRGGNARDGGSIEIGVAAAPETFDPALAREPAELQLLWLVHTPLLTYRREGGREGMEVVPGLARALPAVSDDGLSYRLRLRPRLHYSNGAPVRPADFERAIERLRGLGSPLAPLYDGIASIDADADTGSIRVALTQPDPSFAHLLALPASAPLPRGTPARDLSRRPPPGVGPYRLVRGRARTVLFRTRGFELPGVQPGHVDRISLVRPSPPARQMQAVITGALDVMQEPASVNLLPEIPSRYRERYRQDPTASTVALVPDTESPPLDARSVRRAIGRSLDAQTLTRLYRGLLRPTCNLLPEAIPGYRRVDPCPFGDRDEPPDLPAAEEQIETSAADGAPVQVTADAGVPRVALRQVVRTLRSIGLDASARGGGARIRLRRLEPVLGHPAAFLDPIVRRIFDDELAETIAEGTLARAGEEADDAWADADRRVVEQGYVAPIGTELRPAFVSERLDLENCFRFHPLFGLDLSSLCLR